MTKKINSDFMSAVLEESAWKEISSEFLWTEHLLEKYRNQVDWKAVSGNSNMLWTSSMLEKFKSSIDWKELSASRNETPFTLENLSKFQDYWDWQELSRSISSLEILDKFIDRWDWHEVIDNYSLNDYFDRSFLDKYMDYIPMSSLQQSRLWRDLEEEHAEKLKRQILS